MIGDRDDDHHNDEADDGGIVAKGVKISTDQFFPQTKLAPKISSFSRAFPKNQHRPEKIAPTGPHGPHIFATL